MNSPRSLLCIVGVCIASVSSAQPTATVTGRVESGAAAVPLATVMLLPRPPAAGSPPNFPNFVGRVQTNSGGVFTFSAVPLGNYEICASYPSADFLDTCAWAAKPSDRVQVAVTSGQRVSVPTIRLTKGVRIKVNIADPTGALAKNETRPQQKLQVTVGVPGVGYTFMSPTASTATGRTYEMLVPREQALKLRLTARDLAVADQQGRALNTAAGHEVGINVPASGTPAPLAFTVTGTVAP